MKELWDSILTTYNNYRGTGKGLPLFLVSVLIICIIKDLKAESRESTETAGPVPVPPVFILSPITGIGYAFALLYKEALSRLKGKRLWILMVSFIMILALALGGTRVFKEADHYRAENRMHIKAGYVEVMDALLSAAGESGSIRVMAAPDISPYRAAYSGRFDLMYSYPRHGDPANLGGDERFVYEQMSLSTPDETKVIEKVRKLGYDYIVYDTQKTYMGLPLEEYGYDLVTEVNGFKIYKDSEPGSSAASGMSAMSAGSSGAAVLIFTLIAGAALLAAGVYFLRKSGAIGRSASPLTYLVMALVLLQIIGVIVFSCENPAALPVGISGKRALTVIYTVMPLIMIPAYYCMYLLCADELFDDPALSRFMMLCICILNIWGYQSDALLPVTMLYCWFSWQALVFHGILPFALWYVLRWLKKRPQRKETAADTVLTDEDDYYVWEEEDMKNHKIINARTVAIALLIVVIMLIGSVFIMNRKINSLYEVTVNLQEQVEELKQQQEK